MPPHQSFSEPIAERIEFFDTYKYMEMEPETSTQHRQEDSSSSIIASTVVSDDEECSSRNSRIFSSLRFIKRSPKRSRTVVVVEDDDIQDSFVTRAQRSSLKNQSTKLGDRVKSSSCKSQVSFNSLCIREYNVVFGDHPCCSNGPPLALGWNHDGEDLTFNLDEYESARAPRKARKDLRMTCEVRRQILLLGQTERELQHEERRFSRERQRRARSCATEGFFMNPPVKAGMDLIAMPREKDYSVL